MLPSLGIRNYRNLKSLDIEKLARVNLIAGKNNTGKTSLLEAVSLYASRGNLGWIDNLLEGRGEFYSRESTLKNNRQTYASLFHDRHEGFSDGDQIVVGPFHDVERGLRNPQQLHESLMIRFVKMVEEVVELVEAETGRKSNRRQWRRLEDAEQALEIYRLALVIHFQREDSGVYILDDIRREQMIRYSYNDAKGLPSCQFVTARAYYEESRYAAWREIALTEKEDYVVQALQIVEPAIIRFAYVEDNNEYKPIVSTSGTVSRVPLRGMGDGIYRILAIALALVTAQDGYLLIDEFENGLHHKVQEDLWKMIFQLAKKLNVQVFATTHSEDCVEAFENVLNNGNQNEGLFIRLEKRGEVIKSVLFDAKELQVATDHAIEIR